MITQYLAEAKAALRAVDGVELVTSTWAKGFETLPAIVIRLASEKAADTRDDNEYLTRIEWYVHVFAQKESALMAVAQRAHQAMEDIGYMRTLRWDDHTEGARQVVFRFAKIIYNTVQ